MGDDFFTAVENNFGLGIGGGAEADNDAVDVRHIFRIAEPFEGAVGEVDMNAVVEKAFPERADAVALTDGIG